MGSSWSPMMTIEDEKFFFFWVTLGIKCRIKWVVAALRGLWPRGMFRLMELMFSLVGLLGFLLVSSSFGLFNFRTSPSSVFFFHPSEISFLYFFWETSPSPVSSFSLAGTLLWRVVQRPWGTFFFPLSILSLISMPIQAMVVFWFSPFFSFFFWVYWGFSLSFHG